VTWEELLPLIGAFWVLVVARLELRQQAGRLKQWLNFLRRRYPQAEVAYQALRTLHDPLPVTRWMVEQGALAPDAMSVNRL
jgi:tRNA-dihydrouridine synthase C